MKENLIKIIIGNKIHNSFQLFSAYLHSLSIYSSAEWTCVVIYQQQNRQIESKRLMYSSVLGLDIEYLQNYVI